MLALSKILTLSQLTKCPQLSTCIDIKKDMLCVCWRIDAHVNKEEEYKLLVRCNISRLGAVSKQLFEKQSPDVPMFTHDRCIAVSLRSFK